MLEAAVIYVYRTGGGGGGLGSYHLVILEIFLLHVPLNASLLKGKTTSRSCCHAWKFFVLTLVFKD
jgi:hypothetical protein